MKGFVAVASFVVVAFAGKHKSAKIDHQATPILSNYLSVHESFGNVTAEMSAKNAHRRNANLNRGASMSRRSTGTASHCSFPMNVLFLTDTSGSMTDLAFIELHSTIPAVAASILTTNPGSSFSVVSFEDKPINTLGETTDSCLTVQGLDIAQEDLLALLESIVVGGGYDWPEVQGACVMAVLNSPSTINWFIDPEAVNVIMLTTDTAFHYKNDEVEPNYPELAPWGDSYDESLAAEYCLNRYYPDPFVVADEIVAAATFFGVSVVLPSVADALALRTYTWFNTLLGQSDAMVQALPEDQVGWVAAMQLIVDTVREEVCSRSTTPAPTGTPSTSVPTGPLSTSVDTGPLSTSTDTLSTSVRTGTPVQSTEEITGSEEGTTEATGSEGTGSSEVSTTEECVCDCDGCHHHDCCWKQPAFLLAIKNRPSELDVHYKA